jgi:hypothetical protein
MTKSTKSVTTATSETPKLLVGLKAIEGAAKKLQDTGVKWSEQAHLCLVSALNHIRLHNDTRALDQVFRCIPNAMHRRGASLWVSGMSNLRYNEEANGFKKPKTEAFKIDVEAAQATPFWEYAPARAANQAEIDIVVNIANFIKRQRRVIAEAEAGERPVKNLHEAEKTVNALAKFAESELKISASDMVYKPPKKEATVTVAPAASTIAKGKNAPATAQEVHTSH